MSDAFLERLFSEPSLHGRVPQSVQFSPDSAQMTFLAPADSDLGRLDLYRCDLQTAALDVLLDSTALDGGGVDVMTDAEKAERERRRAFATGISAYQWLPDAKRLLVVAAGAAYLLDSGTGTLTRLTPADTRQSDIRLSPQGNLIGFVRDGDLYLFDIDAGSEKRITSDAEDGLSSGRAEFIAQEEMHRFTGYWFSADERWLVYTRVDERAVPESLRYEVNADAMVAVAQRYPYAGADNADVTLCCYDCTTGLSSNLEWRDGPDDYLARVNIGNGAIWTQSQTRDQTCLTLRRFPLADGIGDPEPVLVERHSTWVNLHDNLTFVPNSDGFLWTSERDGQARLYIAESMSQESGSAFELRCLTSGPGRINRIVHADSDYALVLGWQDAATEQHLFRVPYHASGEDGRGMTALSREPGWHEVEVSPDGRWWVDRWTHLGQPPELTLRSLRDDSAQTLTANRLTEEHPYSPFLEQHVAPGLGTLTAVDGQTLHFRLTRPVDFDPTKRYPVLVNVYGGPGVQRVRNEWAPLSLQLFARAGIAVFELDNRGGSNREKAFEDPIHRCLGEVEVADQLTGVDYLQSLSWVDDQRIGIFGHSYGGYLTLMCLGKAPDQFRAGVAIAPVTDWHLYDTHYTERYLGTPRDNASGYERSGVFAHLEELCVPLLIIHGMADDNVLFSNSTRLFKHLQDRDQRFEMMTYPGAKHALQETDVAIHRYQTMLAFLQRELVG